MQSGRTISVTLPTDLIDAVEAKVSAGAYASVDQLLHEAVLDRLDRDAGVEDWLRDEVARSYDEYKANPTDVVPVDEIMPRIRATGARRAGSAGEG